MWRACGSYPQTGRRFGARGRTPISVSGQSAALHATLRNVAGDRLPGEFGALARGIYPRTPALSPALQRELRNFAALSLFESSPSCPSASQDPGDSDRNPDGYLSRPNRRPLMGPSGRDWRIRHYSGIFPLAYRLLGLWIFGLRTFVLQGSNRLPGLRRILLHACS